MYLNVKKPQLRGLLPDLDNKATLELLVKEYEDGRSNVKNKKIKYQRGDSDGVDYWWCRCFIYS